MYIYTCIHTSDAEIARSAAGKSRGGFLCVKSLYIYVRAREGRVERTIRREPFRRLALCAAAAAEANSPSGAAPSRRRAILTEPRVATGALYTVCIPIGNALYASTIH